MGENHQDKTESKSMATEDKVLLPPSSTKNQRMSSRLKNRTGFWGYDKVTVEYDKDGQHTKTTQEHQPGKTLWDWLQLLAVIAIPLVIAIGTVYFSFQQNQTSMQLANDQQQEATLKSYLDDMSDLLLNHNLSKSKSGDAVSEVARERTLTTLRRLDAARNRIVLQFLQDAHLIGVNAVVDLSGASLSGASLSGANLSGADLSNVNLSRADLSNADLSNADLSNADLSGATLSGDKLIGVNLSNADLSGADLSGADLRRADLLNATLSNADLSGANLSGATVTQEQLAKAKSLKGVTMPGGLTHP